MSAKRLGHMLDALSDPVFAIDPSGTLVDWNEAVCRITGYTDDEIAEMAVTGFFPEEEHERVLAAVEEALEHGHAGLETRVQTKDGEEIPFAFRCNRTQDEAGQTLLVGSGLDLTERRQAERQRDEVAERLSQIVDHTPAIIYTCDPEPPHTITWLCENTRHVLDVPAERLLDGTDTWLDHVHPEDEDEVRQSMAEIAAAQDGGSVVQEYRIVLDGEERWLRQTMRAVADLAGDGPALIASAIDVTERVAAEQRTEESQRRLQQITENLDATAWLATVEDDPSDSQILYLSPGFEAMFGLPEEQIRANPMSFVERVHPEDVDDVMEAMVPDGSGDRSFEVDYRLRFDDGSLKHLRTRGVAIRDDAGEPYRLAGVTEDITDHVEAQQELAESQARFQQVADHIDAAIWMTEATEDPSQGEVLYVNTGMERIFGISEEAFREDPMAFLARVHPEDRQHLETEIGSLGPDDDFELTYRLLREDGTVQHVQTRGHTIVDDRADTARTVGVSVDVTDRVEAERARDEAQERLRRVLGDLNIVVFSLDPDGRYTLAEGRGLQAAGLEPEDILGRHVSAFLGEREERLLEQALQGENVRATVEYEGVVSEIQMGPRYEDGDVVAVDGVALDVTELHRAREEEAFKARLLDEVGQAVNAIEPDGTIRYWNAHAEELFGYTAEEAVGENVYELVDAHAEHVEEIEAHMRRGEGWAGELTVTAQDGSTFPAIFTKEPILDGEGNLEGVIGIAYDVTELRRLEEEEALKASILDQVGEAVVVTDADNEVVYWNREAEELHGYTADEAVGRALREVVFPAGDDPDLDRAFDEVGAALGAGETWQGTVTGSRKDGTTFPTLLTIAPRVGEDGQLLGAIGIGRDISEVEKARSEAELKARMLEQVGQAVIATDPDGTVTYWNAHAEELYGYTAQEALGRPILDLTVPDKEEVRERVSGIMARMEEGEARAGEFTVKHADGSTFPALVAHAPVVDDEGELIGVIGVSQDISDIKQRERDLVRLTNQLRARNRELRELSQATAHEFHTPITDISRYLALVAETAAGRLTEEERDHLATALSGAERMHELVDSLQEFLDASTRRPTFEPTDARQALDTVLAELAEDLEATGAEIEMPAEGPELAIDDDLLTSVLGHLIENALRYDRDGPPRVTIGFEPVDDMWMISVRDEGDGIAPRHHERIFRPFRTLHGVEEGAGPGLGLAQCRGIVEAHGGSIWVDSEEGQGATFYLTLPAEGSVPPVLAEERIDGDQEELAGEQEEFAPETDLWDEG